MTPCCPRSAAALKVLVTEPTAGPAMLGRDRVVRGCRFELADEDSAVMPLVTCSTNDIDAGGENVRFADALVAVRV